MPLNVAILAANDVNPREMRWAMLMLFTIVLLFGVFVLGLLLARIMRHKRQRLERKRPAPTEYVDAWSMHKVPEDQNPPDDWEPPGAEPDDEERPTP